MREAVVYALGIAVSPNETGTLMVFGLVIGATLHSDW